MFRLLLCPQHLEQCLVHSSCSINFWGVSNELNKRSHISFNLLLQHQPPVDAGYGEPLVGKPLRPQALWGLSLFIHSPWLVLQGPPGMRGSPGPPGPAVSICGFLVHLRSSQRGHSAPTPFCCFVFRKLGRPEGGISTAHSFPRQSILWGLWIPTTECPGTGLLCPLCPRSCLEEALRGAPVFPFPIVAMFCTRDPGCRGQGS